MAKQRTRDELLSALLRAEKDVQVSLSSDTLTIRGEKRQDKEEKNTGYHLSERSYGEFQRAFTLPDSVDGEKTAAAFANGVLTVTVPKKARALPKRSRSRQPEHYHRNK